MRSPQEPIYTLIEKKSNQNKKKINQAGGTPRMRETRGRKAQKSRFELKSN